MEYNHVIQAGHPVAVAVARVPLAYRLKWTSTWFISWDYAHLKPSSHRYPYKQPCFWKKTFLRCLQWRWSIYFEQTVRIDQILLKFKMILNVTFVAHLSPCATTLASYATCFAYRYRHFLRKFLLKQICSWLLSLHIRANICRKWSAYENTDLWQSSRSLSVHSCSIRYLLAYLGTSNISLLDKKVCW